MTQKALTTTTPAELVTVDTLPIDQRPAAVYLASLSAASRRTMTQALNTIAALLLGIDLKQLTRKDKDAANRLHLGLNWAALRFQHTNAIRARLAANYAPATANKMLSALRGTLKAAWQLGQVDADAYHKAASVESVKGETLPAGRNIQAGELAALMDACQVDQSAAGVRDAAIIGILYTCGLRRAELVKLDLGDYDADAGALTVHGKGSKDRLAYPTSGALVALADWLTIRGDAPGALFWPVTKGGELRPRRLTTQAVYKMLGKRAHEAGIKDLSPHDFRRTVAGDLLDAGADLVTVQKILGHSDPKTTARYDRRGERAKRKAAELLHIPYHKRVLRAEP